MVRVCRPEAAHVNDELYTIPSLWMGHLQLVQVSEVRGTRIYRGGYSIRYDANGVEVSRSAVSWYCFIECNDKSTLAQMLAHE
jgi:hypothetical protein